MQSEAVSTPFTHQMFVSPATAGWPSHGARCYVVVEIRQTGSLTLGVPPLLTRKQEGGPWDRLLILEPTAAPTLGSVDGIEEPGNVA